MQRLTTLSFPGSFRPHGPTRPGIPKFQISTNSTHPAEITHDSRKIHVQNRSKFFNIQKFLTIPEYRHRRSAKMGQKGRGGDCGQIGSANGANRQGHLNNEKGARTIGPNPLKSWSQHGDSNSRPADYESAALPTELCWRMCGKA